MQSDLTEDQECLKCGKKMNLNFENAILLVAGKGERLKPLTEKSPKPLTEVNGIPILENTLKNLASVGVKRVFLVTGHLNEKLISFAKENSQGLEITEIHSPEFASTNNMFSLWRAKEILQKGCLLLEGDVFFELEILNRLSQENPKFSYWFVDKFTEENDGCMLQTDKRKRITNLEIVRGKTFEDYLNRYKSIGIVSVTKNLGQKLCAWLDTEVEAKNVNVYFDLVVAKHLQEEEIKVLNIDGLKWFEIDDLEDLQKAEKLFS